MALDVDTAEDAEILEEEIAQEENQYREKLFDDVISELGVTHPIIYDGYDICELAKSNKLAQFNMSMLKDMCAHFELSFRSRDVKASLINKLKDMVRLDCTCLRG